jgi:SAM-dependent methyltransferase
MEDLTLITCSYNTPEVTMVMLQSFMQCHPEGSHKIIISENSTNDATSKMLDSVGITYLRNPGSPHAQALDVALDKCETTYALVVDTDIIFHKSCEKLLTTLRRQKATILGQFCGDRGGFLLHPRIHPWFMMLNVAKLREKNIRFYDPVRVAASHSENFYENTPIQENIPGNRFYDVGSTFYEDIVKAGLKAYAYNAEPEYYKHYEGMSWHRTAYRDDFRALGNHTYNLWKEAAEKYTGINIAGKFIGVKQEAKVSTTITGYLGNLRGIEIGKGSQNDYHLNALSVDCKMHDLFNEEQSKFGFAPAHIDLIAEADSIPLEASSQDYVFSSHVIEHLVNPIGAIKEWYRLVRNGGYIAVVIPQRDAAEADRGKPITTLAEFLYMAQNPTILEDTRGHLTRWTPLSFCDFINYGQELGFWNVELVCVQNPDDQIKNGFTVILRVIK